MVAITRDRDEIEDGVVQLRFADDGDNVRDISAADLAEVLEGLVEFTRELSKSGEFGDGAAPRIRIRAPKEGSFILEAIVWLQENPIAAAGLVAASGAVGTAAGKSVADAIGAGIRSLRGQQPVDFDYLENGDVKVKWPDNSATQVRRETWDKLQEMKRPTRRALSKIMTPLNTDADKLEVRDASLGATTDEILSTPADAVAIRTDYLTAIQVHEETYENERIFETEAILATIDFDNSAKWRVKTTREGTRTATIEDVQFLRGLDRGDAIHKNDIFWLKVKETTIKEPGKNVRTEWAVIEVRRTRRGDTDGDSFDDALEAALDEEPASAEREAGA
ncbi:hypothetical protein HCX50_17210 [Microbacterium oxydans]|uniref:hypothetical protein n=1 Tax=Microbacterium sp. B19(2022) TaxID=2914045 RepID=UPI00142F5C44|nr:hypothetical protein [Microbacterium sp. B19(2022)]NJI61168.1 hypothetical protein [Microbacterium sp. B19(2022)]